MMRTTRKPRRCASLRYSATTAFTSRGGIVCSSHTSVISITPGSGNGDVSSMSFCIFAASTYNFLCYCNQLLSCSRKLRRPCRFHFTKERNVGDSSEPDLHSAKAASAFRHHAFGHFSSRTFLYQL